MTKSNREAKGEMGGNVLDEQKAREGYLAFTYDGERYVVRYPKDSTAAEMARAVAAKVPGATAQGETVVMPPHEVTKSDSMTIGGFTAPSVDGVPLSGACSSCGVAIGAWDYCSLIIVDGRSERKCSKCAPPRPLADMRRAMREILDAPPVGPQTTVLSRAQARNLAVAERMLRGEPAREQVKSRAREALRSGDGLGVHDPRRAMVTIARELNSGLHDAYVVRLDGASQFTTYDAEEALDIFAGMVTGEPAARGEIGSDTLHKRQNIARLSGPAGDLRGLAGTVREAVITGAGRGTLDGVTVGVYVEREPAALHVVTGAPVLYIAGTAADLTSLALTLDDAAEQGGAAFLPASGCMVSIARTEAKTAAASPARNPDPDPGQAERARGGRWIAHHPDPAARAESEARLNREQTRRVILTGQPNASDNGVWDIAPDGTWSRPCATVHKASAGYVAGPGGIRAGEMVALAPLPVTIASPDDVDAMFGKGSEFGSIAKRMMSGEPLVLSYRTPRTLATPGGIPAAAPEPTEVQRIAAAILERRCLDMGTPRREGEDDAALTARLNAAEVDRLLAKAVAKGRPWLVGVAYAREGHTVTLPDARAFTAALDALASERNVDAAVETFRRARMATGPTWLRPALERAAREMTGTTAERHEQAAPRVQRTRWADPCAWAEAVNFWERETR